MRDRAAHTLSAVNLSLSGASTLYYELSNNTASGNDIINLSGALDFVSGTTDHIHIPLSSNFASGTYTLITTPATLARALIPLPIPLEAL